MNRLTIALGAIVVILLGVEAWRFANRYTIEPVMVGTEQLVFKRDHFTGRIWLLNQREPHGWLELVNLGHYTDEPAQKYSKSKALDLVPVK